MGLRLALAAVSLAVLACAPRTVHDKKSPVTFSLHVLDNDSGHGIVLDVGETEVIIDPGRAGILARYLQQSEIVQGPIELAVITSQYTYSWQGYLRILEGGKSNNENDLLTDRYSIRELWDPGVDPKADRTSLREYFKFVLKLELHPVQVVRPLSDTYRPATTTGRVEFLQMKDLPDIRIAVLSSAIGNGIGARGHDGDIALLIDIGGIRILLPADGRAKDSSDPASIEPQFNEARLLQLTKNDPNALRADILVAPYHGSELASTTRFIEAVSPSIVLFVGSRPTQGSPGTVIDRYNDGHRRLYSTSIHRQYGVDHIVCSANKEDDEGGNAKANGDRINCSYLNTARLSKGEVSDSRRQWASPAPAPAPADPDSDEEQGPALTYWEVSKMLPSRRENGGTPEGSTKIHALKGKDLRGINLRGRPMTGMNFEGTDFGWADLEGVDLSSANLADADLRYARLNSARLVGSNLTGARLRGANLDGAIFEPASGKLPTFSEFTEAPYLKSLTFDKSPHALIELREQFKKSGLRHQQRELTYAIQTTNMKTESGLMLAFHMLMRYVCGFGLEPWRPLYLLFLLWLICAACYYLAARLGENARIFVLVKARTRKDASKLKGRLLPLRVHHSKHPNVFRRFLRSLRAELRLAGAAMNFSLQRALDLKFQWLDAGTWIKMIQKTDMEFIPRGWVRPLSGIQSLLGLALLAVAILVFLGDPFE